MPVSHHQFLQARCSSRCQSDSIKTLKATLYYHASHKNHSSEFKRQLYLGLVGNAVDMRGTVP